MYLENKPVENPELLVALKLLSEEASQENQIRLSEAVIKGNFISPVNIGYPDGMPTTTEDGKPAPPKVGFVLLKNPDGMSFVPAFSDWAHLLAWNANACSRAAVMNFSEYYAMVTSEENEASGVIFNPGDNSAIFNRKQIELLKTVVDNRAAAIANQQIPEGAKIMIGDLPTYPEDLVQALSEALGKEEHVKTGYLRIMKIEQVQSWLLVIKLDGDPNELFGGNPKELFDRIVGAVRPATHGLPLNIVLEDLPLGQQAVKNGKEPFYNK